MATRRAPLARRLLAGLGVVLSALGLTALFALGATGALLLHLDLPASRRVTAGALGKLLASVLQGQINIGKLSRVRPYEVVAEDIVVRDVAHRVVLKVTRLTARADLMDILKRVLRGDPKLTIIVNHVRVERAEADVIPDESGVPTLAQAFTPRPSPPGTPPSVDRGEYVRVWLPAIELGSGYARGTVGGSPTLEVDLSGVHGSVLATPKGAAIDIARFSLVEKGVGGTDAKGIASLHIRAPGAVWGSLDGYIGDIQFGGTLRYEKEELDVKLDVPRAEPSAARALLGTWPLLVPTQARVRAKGKPTALALDLDATFGESSTVAGSGRMHLAAPASLQLELEGRKLDLRALWADAPPTAFDVDTTLELRNDQGRSVVSVGGSLQRTSVLGYAIPSADFSGSTASGPFTGQAKLHDVGLPVDATFSLFPDGKIQVEASAKRVNLAQAERLKPYFDGSGNADVRLHAALERGRLDSSITLDLRDLAYKGVTLKSGRVLAAAHGPVERLDQITLDAKLSGKQLAGAGLAFDDVQGSARGPLGAPNVTLQLSEESGASLDASAKVTLGAPVSVRALAIGIQRNGVELHGEVAQLDVSAERVLVRELKLHGATGELTGSADFNRGSLGVVAHARNLDLSAVSRVLGLPRGQLEGRASLELDAVATRETQSGTLQLALDRAVIGNLNGISAQLSTGLDGKKLTGELTGSVESLGSLSASWDAMLAGRPHELSAYEHATGELKLALKDVTLAYLGQLLPSTDVDVAGSASLNAHLSRSDGSAVPDLEASLETQGLRVSVPRQGRAPFVLEGVELLASTAHGGDTGETSLTLGAVQRGQRLLSVTADMVLDPKAALLRKEPLVQQLETRPLQAKLVVNQLDLETLPEPLRLPGLRGALRLEGSLRGSAREPTLSLLVRAANLRLAPGDRAEPVDLCATAEYAKASGAFNVGAEAFLPLGFDLHGGACSGRRFATARWTGVAPLEHGYQGWSGTALASLESLPLAVIPPLADAGVTGNASGRVLLDRSASQPSASAELTLSGVKVERIVVGDGSVGLRTNGNRARAEFEIVSGNASVQGQLNAGVVWPSDMPALDDAQPIDVALRAQQLQASVLEPLLEDFLAELRGVVDGNLNARLQALGSGQTEREVESIDGKLALKDGAFVLNGLGYRMREVSFAATATREGQQTVVDVPNLTANAGAKTKNLSAYVRLQLRGLKLNGGQARVAIRRLPLVVDGITRANADADFSMDLQRRPEKMFVELTFDNLYATLPKESSRELTDLKEHPEVTLLQPIVEPRAQRAQDDLPWHFLVHLGVKAKLERNGLLDLPLSGDPNVVLAQSLGVTGTINLRRGGAVQLLGKVFVIEGGGVVFDTPDPNNPRLDIQASWRTNDGDTLFLYVTGTLSKPKLRFDRPDEQAWALLLGGDASDITLNALDTLLADTPLAGVQVSKSTSDDPDTGDIYTAAYRLGDRFIVEGNYQEAITEGPGDTTGSVGAAVDWRITKAWSLRAQLGTIGTGVDIVYQYRY